jgi:hypothetical protein
MSQLIKYATEEGDIFIESKEEATGEEFIRVGITEKAVTTITKKLDDSLAKIQYISNKIINSIDKKSDNTPNEITVEFGIKLGGEADFIVASGSAEANFGITFKWQKK